jgi:hypothetical protein
MTNHRLPDERWARLSRRWSPLTPGRPSRDRIQRAMWPPSGSGHARPATHAHRKGALEPP